MNPKIFHGLLSTFIAISFLLALYVSVYQSANQFLIFFIIMVMFGGVPSVILSLIHVVQREKQKKREKQKTEPKPSPEIEIKEKAESKPTPEIETPEEKSLIGMIQKRLARGEISIQEFQELKKEISS